MTVKKIVVSILIAYVVVQVLGLLFFLVRVYVVH
jgi:hypothetical protein